MSWSINEVAKMTGLTSRTLRHYQAIGLLEPESVEFSGRRLYGQRELLRLQEILVLRELGLPLKTIARMLEEGREERREALLDHLDWLNREHERLGRLIRTVERTIEEGETMTPQELFEGIEENPYEAEARERWGDPAVDASQERWASLTPEQASEAKERFNGIHSRLASLLEQDVPPEDREVQAVIADHHALVSEISWSPDAESYPGLGQLYVEDERFRKNIGQGNDALVTYLRDAMTIYARESLPCPETD